jgi:hypothetical protein
VTPQPTAGGPGPCPRTRRVEERGSRPPAAAGTLPRRTPARCVPSRAGSAVRQRTSMAWRGSWVQIPSGPPVSSSRDPADHLGGVLASGRSAIEPLRPGSILSFLAGDARRRVGRFRGSIRWRLPSLSVRVSLLDRTEPTHPPRCPARVAERLRERRCRAGGREALQRRCGAPGLWDLLDAAMAGDGHVSDPPRGRTRRRGRAAARRLGRADGRCRASYGRESQGSRPRWSPRLPARVRVPGPRTGTRHRVG